MANHVIPLNVEPGPWHEGERMLQGSLGVADRMGEIGSRVIRDHMPDQHRQLFEQLPFVVFAAVDPAGDVWASMFTGQPGFIRSPSACSLEISLDADDHDPARKGLAEGEAIGLLGIELATRRRNRMNGRLTHVTAQAATVTVEHSFGNCPRYIQRRDWQFRAESYHRRDGPGQFLAANASILRDIVGRADTFFVASYADTSAGRQVDVSHRGGKPGFVRIEEDGMMTIPDFSGNLHFNTLGNFMVNPNAGLLFVDFEAGDVLQLTGAAKVAIDSPEIGAFEGAERFWTFTPRKAFYRCGAIPLLFTMRQNGWSPNTIKTGEWPGTKREAPALPEWAQYGDVKRT